ncbi:hypothetical protein CJF30_00009770 [Rutstroemia sp. NJR-2017a BBW]|nr:hypothetical protein CJF30_00009770 [Rutstroemia sp. NJR-2017a BBW]
MDTDSLAGFGIQMTRR